MMPAMLPGLVSYVPVMVPVPVAMPVMHPTADDVAKAKMSCKQQAQEKRAPKAKKGKQLKPEQNPRQKQQQQKQPGSSSDHQSQESKEEEGGAKAVISMLQEFVQCSKQFPSPQHRPILQWRFETQMGGFTNLEFRATVAFLLDGVPHHVAGSWHQSKKMAQRDAAERCLAFFVGCWGTYVLEEGGEMIDAELTLDRSNGPVELLDEFCSSFAPCGGEAVVWSIDSDCSGFRACAELSLLGVQHTFAGDHAATEEEAKADTAKRVLWYLQCPGFDQAFEPDPNSHVMTAKELAEPPACWLSPAESSSVEIAERKTLLMKVQNRLQQHYGKNLKSGQSIWKWTFEMAEESAWPPLCRATATIPAVGKSFKGAWARGRREAQVETCRQISCFLDGGNCASPTGSVGSTSATSGDFGSSRSRGSSIDEQQEADQGATDLAEQKL